MLGVSIRARARNSHLLTSPNFGTIYTKDPPKQATLNEICSTEYVRLPSRNTYYMRTWHLDACSQT